MRLGFLAFLVALGVAGCFPSPPPDGSSSSEQAGVGGATGHAGASTTGGQGGSSGVAGSSGSAGSSSAPYPTLADFCQAVATAECSTGVINNCAIGSTDACTTAVSQLCTDGHTDPTSDFDISFYNDGNNVALAQACIAAITAAYTTGSISSTGHQAIITACTPIFSKNVPTGGPCTADADCRSPNRCKLIAAGSGTCEGVTLVAVGGDCSQSSQFCDTGLFCLAGHNCVSKNGLGDACSTFSEPCSDDLLCTPSDTGSGGSSGDVDMPGTCTAKEGDSGPCTSDNDCVSGYCTAQGTATPGCSTTVIFGVGSPLCTDFGG